MRKDVLIKLLSTKKDDSLCQAIQAVINEFYAEVPEDEEIAFAEIANHLTQKGKISKKIIDIQEKNYSNRQSFYLLLTGKLLPESTTQKQSLFMNITKSVRTHSIFPLLDANSIGNISGCSYSLYAENKVSGYWFNRFLVLKLNKKLLEKVFQANVIKNYKALYQKLLRIKDWGFLEAWELLVLSGEVAAFNYAIQNEGLTAAKEGVSRLSVLHYAAWSGSVSQMRAAVKLGVEPNNCNTISANVVHFAAWSGSFAAIEEAIKLGIAVTSRDMLGRNILHYAARGGSVTCMRKCIELGIPQDSTDNAYANALQYAALEGNIAAMHEAIKMGNKFDSTELDGSNMLHNAVKGHAINAMREAIKLGISPFSKTSDGENIFHLAADMGSVELMQEALRLGVSPTDLTNGGANILHLAAMSAKVKAVNYVRELKAQLNLALDPKTPDTDNKDAFWYAYRSCNPTKIKKALNKFYKKSEVGKKRKLDTLRDEKTFKRISR